MNSSAIQANLAEIQEMLDDRPSAALKLAQEMLLVTKTHPNPVFYPQNLYLAGMSYWELRQIEQAMELFQLALELMPEDGDPKLRVLVSSVMSLKYSQDFERNKAEQLIQHTLSLMPQVQEAHTIIRVHSRLGSAFIRLGLYAEALSQLLLAHIKIKEMKPAIHPNEGFIQTHLSIVQARIGNYKESHEWSNQAEAFFKVKGDPVGLVTTYINRGLIYHKQGRMPDCIRILEKSLKIAPPGPQSHKGIILSNLGKCYLHQDTLDIRRALQYYSEGYLHSKKNQSKHQLAFSLSGIIKCCTRLKTHPPDLAAEEFGGLPQMLDAAIRLAEEADVPIISKDIYATAVEYYEASSQYQQALRYQRKLGETQERISLKERDEKVFSIHIQYQTAEREMKLRQLELEKREMEVAQKKELEEINRQLEEKVKLRTNELMEKNKELSEYTYVMAHDLKEPIRTVRQFSEMIAKKLEGDASPEMLEIIHFVVSASNNVSEMVDALLEYSTIRVQAENMTDIDTHKMIEKVLLGLTHSIQSNGAQILLGQLPATIQGDPIRIRQLFQNLINNAIKFQKPDVAPVIRMNSFPVENGVGFSVTDNGIGIEPRHQPKIFGLFKRLHTREKYTGSGIGLSICQKIVHQHNGRIWVESEEGTGTTFHFTLNA